MPVPSAVYRQAAQAVQRTLISKSPSLRTTPTTPPHPRHWVQLDQPTKHYTPHYEPAAPPVPRLSTLVLPKPPFQELSDRAAFEYHQSEGRTQVREEQGTSKGKGTARGKQKGRPPPSFASRDVRFLPFSSYPFLLADLSHPPCRSSEVDYWVWRSRLCCRRNDRV
jgi:hypothetical protein